MTLTGIRRNVKFATTIASASLVLATGIVSLAPGVATAAGPSGGPTLTAVCNKYTGEQQGGNWEDDFTGLIGNSSAGYKVFIYYSDPVTGDPEQSYDDTYWFADPDGSYHHTYPDSYHVPARGTSFTWSLYEYAGGSTYPDILTGSGAVGGPVCTPKAKKPNDPDIAPGAITVTKKGKFDVDLTVDKNVTGSVAVSNASGQLASKGYSSHSNTAVDVTLALGKKDLKHLKKVKSYEVKIKATSTNHAGVSKGTGNALLKAPKH